MSFFKQWHIDFFQDEYLEIELPAALTITDKQRVFYLHEERYLTCFVHPREEKHLYFDCGRYISMKSYLGCHKINQMILTDWLKTMMDVFEMGEQAAILDDINYVFLDHEGHCLHFIRLPVKIPEYRQESAFQSCLWSMLEEIDFDGDEAWLSRLYMLTKQKSFRFAMLRSVLERKEERRRFPFFFRKKRNYEEDFFTAFEIREQSAVYGAQEDLKTTMLNDDLKTQILMAGFQYGYLEDEEHQTFFISQNPWLIGRQEICQLCLKFPEVSKQHAQLSIEQGKCHIEDLGSTNKSAVNGEVLVPHTKRELNDLDEIVIAGHRFIYHE